MPKITTAGDAAHAVATSYRYTARDFEPITSDDDQLIGWTFAAGRASSYGWILTDGRICHATEWTRDNAETGAHRSV